MLAVLTFLSPQHADGNLMRRGSLWNLQVLDSKYKQSTNQDWLKFVAWNWYNIVKQAGMWYLCTIVKFHQLTILLYLQYFAPPIPSFRKKSLNFVCLNSSKLFVGKLRAVYKSRIGDFDGGAFWQKFSAARAGKAFIANEMWKIFTNYTTQSKRTAKYSKGGLS